MKLFKTEREYENSHVFLWLVKDTSWCHSWRWLGMAMILPTLAVQLHLTWNSRRDVHEIFHSVAVACWISANAVWMTGEFFYGDGLRSVAAWFFGTGVACMAFYYLFMFGRRRE